MCLFFRVTLRLVVTIPLFLYNVPVKAQDSILTHWPTVQQSPYDTSKRVALHRQIVVLLAKPVEPNYRERPLAPGSGPGWSMLQAAQNEMDQRNFSAATRNAEQALTMAREAHDRRLEMLALGKIGSIAREVFLGSSLKAVPYHEEALEIAEMLRDSAYMIKQIVALVDNYYQAGRNDRMLEYAERAAALLAYSEQPPSRMRLSILFGAFMASQGEMAAAEQIFRSSIPLARAIGDFGYVQHLYCQLFGLYLEQRNVEQAGIALDSMQAIGPRLPAEELYEAFYQLEKMRGNREQAFRMLEKAYQSMGNRYVQRSAEQLAGWEAKLRTREKDLELAEQKRQRWLWIWLVFALAGLFVGSVYAFFQQRKSRKKLTIQNALIERQSAELRHLDEAKSRFFANVSHELRTPLTLMIGPLGSMLKAGRLDARDQALGETAQQHGKQLLRLVNEILDLSKMESGKMKLQETAVSLQPFLLNLMGTFESHAERLGIRFLFEYKISERLRVLVDEDKLQKVLNNLLSNALKFTPAHSGGTVTVRVLEAGNNIHLGVEDTGRGIHPEDLPHVFERFYQTNQADMPIEGGTGIGLALCREFAELMKGKIWAESTLGHGSVFCFEFPKKEVLDVSETTILGNEMVGEWAHAPEASAMTGKNGVILNTSGQARSTILVVEDNDGLRDYVKMILSTHYRVETAQHGQAALDVLAVNTSGVQLIISDVMMPVMDGFQFVEKIKNDNRYRHIPVVMLTARADLRDKLKALRIGVDDYLLKPFEEEELLVRVGNLLKNAESRQALNHKHLDEPPAPLSPDPLSSAEDLVWLAELEKTVERAINDTHFSADVLADAMLTSRTKFFQQVKRLTGMTPNEYVLEVRFNKARRLLEGRTAGSVKAAAGLVGFRDVEYFSKQFRTRFGKAPSEYLG